MQWNKRMFHDEKTKPYANPKVYNQFTKPLDLLDSLMEIAETKPKHIGHVCNMKLNKQDMVKSLMYYSLQKCDIQERDII